MYHVNTCYHYWILLMYIYWHDKPWLFLGLNWINDELHMRFEDVFFHHYFLSFWGARCQWLKMIHENIATCRKIRFGPDLWQLRLQFLGGGAWWCYLIDLYVYIYICIYIYIMCGWMSGKRSVKTCFKWHRNIRNHVANPASIYSIQHRGVADWDALAGFGILSTGWPLGSGVSGVRGAVQVCKH